MNPVLSVIIPTYNCESFLDECLGSVLWQLPPDHELIIVDDGSTDRTVSQLTAYDGKSDNLTIVCCEHKGAAGARNTGLKMAKGEYLTFLDCDDCIRDGFFAESRKLLKMDADLYIFGIERVLMNGNSEFWTVKDKVYPDISAFADDYIRKRNLMIYSNCNKFYKRKIIEEFGICFDEDIEFGEDRLFNFRYIAGCDRIVTSSLVMLRYIQRCVGSMSAKHVPDFFERIIMLHKAKTECLLALSKGTSADERKDFVVCDLCREIENTIERFGINPQEIEENLHGINELVFGSSAPEIKAWYDIPEVRRDELEKLKKRIIGTIEV
ncbi:MAG: glycosyltransferase family 2 protein [Clostridia bacterium]|nr:glycosyltransferase family 2 protein [Clostridia bacterium]